MHCRSPESRMGPHSDRYGLRSSSCGRGIFAFPKEGPFTRNVILYTSFSIESDCGR